MAGRRGVFFARDILILAGENLGFLLAGSLSYTVCSCAQSVLGA